MNIVKFKTVTQLERVHLIYQALEKEPLTVNDIYEKLKNSNIKVGLRQIYHDLNQISLYYLRNEEKIMFSVGQFNRKIYRLIKPSEDIELSPRDLTTFQLTRSSMPRLLQVNRLASVNKFREGYRKFINNNAAFYSFIPDNQNFRTFFYESAYDEKYDQKLDDIIWSIANYKIIRISNLQGDATCVPKKLVYPLSFKPLLLIFHRGNHYIAGYEESIDLFLTIDIAAIGNYELTNEVFAFKKLIEPAKKEIESRFGISNNMNNETYQIELEFSAATGEFLRHYHWHATQKTSQLANGNWLMQMECGINRELLSWLFLWMENVRIIQPTILIDLYKDKLTAMAENLCSEIELKYRNIVLDVQTI